MKTEHLSNDLVVTDLCVELFEPSRKDSEGVPVLEDISFTVRSGETYALLGESGCGKSLTGLALLRLLPGVARITSGSIRVGECLLDDLPESAMRQIRGRQLAMIFQEPSTSLNPVMTVGQQIEEALVVPEGEDGDFRSRGVALLKSVGISDPDRRYDEYPFQMSGGMRQRVMIAMALAGNPAFLVADEPTTALDVTIQAQLLELLEEIQRQRSMGMLLITHDIGVAVRMARRFGIMYAGQLVEEGPVSVLGSLPAHPYTRDILNAVPDECRGKRLAAIPGQVPPLSDRGAGCRYAPRCSSRLPVCDDLAPEWSRLGMGHRVRCHLYAGFDPAQMPYPLASPSSERVADFSGSSNASPPERVIPPNSVLPHGKSQTSEGIALGVRHLKVHFPVQRGLFRRTVAWIRAVDDVSFELKAGKTLALVGESGCGKTTVGKALLDLIPKTGGEVYGLFSESSNRHTSLQGWRHHIQMIFQDPFSSLNPRMTIRQILAEGPSALGIPPLDSESYEQILQRVGLEVSDLHRYPHEFSGGQRQRIAIARALTVRPSILVCDEPTSALDVSVQAQVLNLMRSIQLETGVSYLFITHNFSVVYYMADDIAVMYLGRIVETGSVGDVLVNPRHPYTQALLSSILPLRSSAKRHVALLPGEIPSPSRPPEGCHFHPRCFRAQDLCKKQYPVVQGDKHRFACHFPVGASSEFS